MTHTHLTSNIVQGLWIGERLSLMERLSIQSFLHHGHEFHLYLTGPCDGVPAGTTIRDVRDILPDTEVFRYRRGYGKGSPSAFANLFRYALLFQRGGWWVDLDFVALHPFRFEGETVLGVNRNARGQHRVGNGVIHCLPGSALMARCLKAASQADRQALQWGETGSRMLHDIAVELGLEQAMKPSSVFFPIDARDFWQFLRPNVSVGDAVAVHLYHQQWRHYGLDPNGRYVDTSLYERMIARYLPEVAAESRTSVNLSWVIVRSLPKRVMNKARFSWRRHVTFR